MTIFLGVFFKKKISLKQNKKETSTYCNGYRYRCSPIIPPSLKAPIPYKDCLIMKLISNTYSTNHSQLIIDKIVYQPAKSRITMSFIQKYGNSNTNQLELSALAYTC